MEQQQIQVTRESFNELRDLVECSILDGSSGETFVGSMRGLCERNGWNWFAPGSKQDFNWRAMQLYRAASGGRHCAQRLAQLRDSKFSWWIYRSGVECTEHHADFDGLALKPDHEFWNQHMPPTRWHCDCYIVGTHTDSGINRLNGNVDKRLPDSWNAINGATGFAVGVEEPWNEGPEPALELLVAAIAGGDAPPRPI